LKTSGGALERTQKPGNFFKRVQGKGQKNGKRRFVGTQDVNGKKNVKKPRRRGKKKEKEGRKERQKTERFAETPA